MHDWSVTLTSLRALIAELTISLSFQVWACHPFYVVVALMALNSLRYMELCIRWSTDFSLLVFLFPVPGFVVIHSIPYVF